MEENLIIETWDLFREYISEKQRDLAAEQYIDFLVGNDVEMSTLESVKGYDPSLDRAINLIAETTDELDEEEEWEDGDLDEE